MGKQDRHYEDLYSRLLERGETMHANNKKRIRIGLILLGLLPAVLIIIRLLTDSDRVVFLIIWVVCMVAICTYLISIEFIDDSLPIFFCCPFRSNSFSFHSQLFFSFKINILVSEFFCIFFHKS